VPPPRNPVGRNRFSLTTLASASPHCVGPLSEDITPSTQPVRVRKFACANVLILMSSEIAHDSRLIRGLGSAETHAGSDFEAFIPAHLNASGQRSEFDRAGLRAGDAEEGVLWFRVQI
jgi:hypothetical protein